MNIINFFIRLWETMFQYFWFSKKSITNKMNIYVKSNTGSTLSIDLDPKWDIKNVKEVIAPKLGMEPNEVKIIFAGKELDDSIVIEECDLGEKSIIHAVRSRTKSQGSKPLNEILSDFTLSDISEIEDTNSIASTSAETSPLHLNASKKTDISINKNSTNQPHFYVYCSECNSIKTGKLRVRCVSCKSGAITVDKDPASWTDVLVPKRISGHCEEMNCETGAVSWTEFYFKCSSGCQSGNFTKTKGGTVPLHLIRFNISSIPCLACGDVNDLSLVFPNCGHATCLPCFETYCISRLNERQFIFDENLGYTVDCPVRCKGSKITEPHHFRLLPPNYYNKYKRFSAEEYVLKSGGVLCPQPGCGAGIIADSECNKITCIHGCGYVFCRNCLQGYHLGECESSEIASEMEDHTYSFDPTRIAQARWDEASKVAIRVTTKPCPKCRTPTERAGGCMHMVCTRCTLEWCWLCQSEWNRDCMGSHWFE